MEQLAAFILKSILIAGVTLGLLHLLRGRSASERNMVAHFGLLALLVLPLGSMFLPQLVVSNPTATVADAAVQAPTMAETVAVLSDSPAPLTATDPFSAADFWPLLYGVPVAILLGITLLAVLRLLALRTKASVLVEPTWLSALAHAQRRMDFKHGTALLTSRDLKSPISWGLVSPVILLNEEALSAQDEAEAIIAHELAHVRGLDWAKLLLSRIVTALYWMNPLVWILAREAHQLREETADDAVLAADVSGPDYAQLLVGVARHDCRGLLLGAHGVAPSRSSLSRRVRRVLDSSLPRTPAARGFAAGIALGVVGTAAPLAALTFTPTAAADPARPYYVSAPEPASSLPAVVARSVADAAALTSETVAAHVSSAITGDAAPAPGLERRIEAQLERQLAEDPLTPAPPQSPKPVRPRTPQELALDRAISRAVAAKSLGITPDYAAQIRAAAPGLAIDDDDLTGLKAVGVTPEWLRDMTRSGYRARDIGDLTGARAVGVNGAYVADLAAAGLRNVDLGDLTAMRAMGIDGRYIRSLQQRGLTGLTPDRLIELRALGFTGMRVRPPTPPRSGARSPEPPEVPEPPEDVGDPDPDQ